MDITNLSITELKAVAFDSIVKIEQLKNDVQVIQDLIAKKMQEDNVEVVKEETKEEVLEDK